MRNVKCSYCDEYRNEWCEKIIDSPCPDILRDCQYFHEAKMRWIPVTERLPDKYTTVIVSCIDDSGDTPFDYTACGYWVGLLPDDDPAWIVDGEVDWHVVAWMPLPEPWRK